MGRLPLAEKYLKKRIRLKTSRRLERDGWVLNGEGFADSKMTVGVYKSYYRDELVEIPKTSAIPHYPVFSGSPDYWMYGQVVRRSYIHLHLDSDRIEDRGTSYHKSDKTITFKHSELKWEPDECEHGVGWFGTD
jgi:hypothetical protein